MINFGAVPGDLAGMGNVASMRNAFNDDYELFLVSGVESASWMCREPESPDICRLWDGAVAVDLGNILLDGRVS